MSPSRSLSADEDKDEEKDADYLKNVISSQEQTLLAFRGRGINLAIVELAARRLERAPIHPDFVKFHQAPFLYEKLDGEKVIDGEKVNDIVLKIVEHWENVESSQLQ